MAQNMYRVGDYVYFEVHHGAPYQIRKIEELNKTQTGNVEAKVVCYYRRRDVSAELLRIADQAERRSHDSEEEGDSKKEVLEAEKDAALPSSKQSRVSASQPRESRAGSASQPSERRAASAASDHTGSVGGSNGNVVKEEAAKEKKENGASDTEKAESSKAEVKEENGLREWGDGGLPLGSQQLDVLKRHVLRQRELFGSRVVETLPATHIRGKCFVTLLSEVETPESYDKEDCFFYSLMYDPTQMTLLADKGCIKVGEKYQAYVPATMEESRGEGLKGSSEESKENGTEVDDLMIAEEEESAPGTAAEAVEGEQKQREIAVYHPHHSLTDRDIDQFLIIARAVGTFSRALDTSSSTKLPSLHMTAAAASRDVTLFHAMALLHQAKYDIGQATKYLVPPPSKAHYPLDADRSTGHNTISLGGPILCRDQMEEWSAAEANLFEEAIEKYGKDFNDVKNDFLPWKCIRDVVEYYYMWKTTNRYSETKKNKHPDQDSKLKQVYIPNYNKPNPNLVCGIPTANAPPVKSGVLCEGCQVSESIAWYAWGPHALHLRLCQDCWTNWKKMGGLRRISQYEYFDLGDCVVNVKPPITQAHNAFAINKHAPPSRLGAASTTRGVTQQVIARLPPTHSQAHGQAVSAKEYKFNCFDKTFGFVRDEAFNMVLTGNELQIPHYDQRSQKDT